MLRYFYILCIFICFQFTVGYDQHPNQKHYRQITKPRKSVRDDRKYQNRKLSDKAFPKLRSHDIFNAREPKVQIDVASFIQPDYYASDNKLNEPTNEIRQQFPRHYNDYETLTGSIDDGDKKMERNQDYSNIDQSNTPDANVDPTFIKDPINQQHFNLNTLSLNDLKNAKDIKIRDDTSFKDNYQDELITDKIISHNPVKKCSLKHMKFPFFFRKSEIQKPKKEKKKKSLCINCSQKDDDSDIFLKVNERNYKFDDRINQSPYIYNKASSNKKRSYEELNNKDNESLVNVSEEENNEPEAEDSEYNEGVVFEKLTNNRDKRADMHLDRERQMKELEEIQRKIDNVEIQMPTYQTSHFNIETVRPT